MISRNILDLIDPVENPVLYEEIKDLIAYYEQELLALHKIIADKQDRHDQLDIYCQALEDKITDLEQEIQEKEDLRLPI